MTLHIVHGVISLGVGGLERLVLNMIPKALGSGHRVSILCLEDEGRLGKEAAEAGADVICLNKKVLTGSQFRKIAFETLQRIQPSIVHTHQIGAVWHLGPACRALSCPLIHSEHGNHFISKKSLYSKIKHRIFVSLAARYVQQFCCVSSEIAREASRFGTVSKKKITLVNNGIETECRTVPDHIFKLRSEFGISHACQVIGTVGRLAEVKRQDILIKAFYLLKQSLSESKLLIVGDGDEKVSLQNLAMELKIADSVIFAGYQSKPDLFLSMMNVFALTSRSEGLPVSILEAWRKSLPVVASNVGGVKNLISHGSNGLLFEPGDFVAASNLLSSVLLDDKLATILGKNGKDCLVKEYSLDQMNENYWSKYQLALQSRR